MNKEIFTPQMLAKHFKVTTLCPYNKNFQNPVDVQGRKTYNRAKAVSISITENKKFGFSAAVYVIVNGHYRKVSWNNLSDNEKIKVQNILNI